MSPYVMLGKYTLEGVKGISAKRTEDTTALIERNGGKLTAAYTLLGEVDLVFLVEMPDTASAMKTAVALSKLLGVSFTTLPAMKVEDFDKIIES